MYHSIYFIVGCIRVIYIITISSELLGLYNEINPKFIGSMVLHLFLCLNVFLYVCRYVFLKKKDV